ncbi:hypothetical protein [Lactococcus petauri]|uniref:hypothetical protein n=1 Tax=Lactococcus petauri TaxID=1940789 RepID=UPI003851F171
MVITNSDGSKTYYNSETDSNLITVADVSRMEIEKAASIDSVIGDSLRDENPRSQMYPLNEKV